MTLTQLACRNVLRNRRTYAAYFLSSSFSVTVFYVCALFIFHPVIRGGATLDGALQALIVAEGIIYLFSLLFVLYSVSSFLRSRTQEFGILLLHGMTRRQLYRMVFLENMLIGLGAILTGIAVGVLTGKLFLMIGSSFLDLDTLAFYIDWHVLALTVCSFVLLFLSISAITSFMLRKGKLIELLHAGQQTKAVPAVSWLQSAAAVALIGISYILAATATVNSIYVRVVPVTAMTISGTYLFYSQAAVALTGLLKRNKQLFWYRTNIVAISGLAHRLKDHSRMFFMVTVISTVAFCSVGFFASVTTFSDDLAADYPAAIAYIAKSGHDGAAELRTVTSELDTLELAYNQWSMPIQYVRVSTDSSSAAELPLIAYSNYVHAMHISGHDPIESPLEGSDALVMLGSQRDRTLLGVRDLHTYILLEESVELRELREIGYTSEVVIPDHLVSNASIPGNGEFSGLVVSDVMMDLLHDESRIEYYTGYYVRDLMQTSGIAADLAPEGVIHNEEMPYALAVSGTLFDVRSSLYSTMLFIALLIGIVFFVAAGSFLYFRLYAELAYDRRQYHTLVKIGLTERELKRVITQQVAWLFFGPFGLAILHSVFAFMALQQLFYLSIAARLGSVLAGFVIAQTLYFLLIRNRYWRHIRKILRY